MFVFLNNAIEAIFIALLGLVFGSFISALTWRIPRGKDFLKGRSVCDNCKRNLPWYVNIPLFSFLFLRGRSRCCKKKISIRYPLIEAFTAFAFVFLYISFGFSILHATYYVLLLVSLSIFIIDFEHQFIPDEFSWLVAFLGVFISGNLMFEKLFSGFIFALILLVLHVVTRGRGMGLGDVKLAIGLGVWLGLVKGLTWLMVSFVLGGIVALMLLLLKKANLKTKIAFGPFLIIGFWLVYLYF